MRTIDIEGSAIYCAEAAPPPTCKKFIGREQELALCRAAWGIDKTGKRFNDDMLPMHFRLEGPPGVGKNEIIYELARQLDMPLFIMQGHEEFTPEDMAILLVPDTDNPSGVRMRASPLATALHLGGIVFFDELNRVPPRALSPLSSVLDSRQELYSAMTGVRIRRSASGRRFRFCAAVNPASGAGSSGLPDYIDERTLPAITVGYPTLTDLLEILQGNLPRIDDATLRAFEDWFRSETNREMSVRQALTLLAYASNRQGHGSIRDGIEAAARWTVRGGAVDAPGAPRSADRPAAGNGATSAVPEAAQPDQPENGPAAQSESQAEVQPATRAADRRKTAPGRKTAPERPTKKSGVIDRAAKRAGTR